MSKVKEQRKMQQRQLEQDTIAYSRFVEQLMEKYQLSVLNFYQINDDSGIAVNISRATLENSSNEVSEEVLRNIYEELTKFMLAIPDHTKRLDVRAHCQRGVVEPIFNEMIETKRKGAGSKVSELILYRDRKITSKTKDPVSGKVARHWIVSNAPKTPSHEYLFDYLPDNDEER